MHPSFHNYNTDDGLPSSEIHVCFQDHKGYMWFGTDNGLSRFDGYKFKNYGYEDGLKNPVVVSLLEDKDLRLWILTITGKIYFMESDSIYPYQYNSLISKYDFYIAQYLNLTAEGEIFLALKGAGILKIDSAGQETIIRPSFEGHIVIDSAKVFASSSYYKDRNAEGELERKKKILDSGLSDPRLIITENERQTYTIPWSYIPNGGTNFIKLSDSVYYAGSGGNFGLIKNESVDTFGVELTPFSNEYIDKQGKLWMGLHDKQGIRVYSHIDDFLSTKYQGFLKGFSVTDIFEDKKNSLWISTIESGVFYIASQDFLILDQSAGLSNSFVSSVSLKNGNEIYLSLFDKDNYYFNLSTNNLLKLDLPLNSSYNFDIKYNRKNGDLYAGYFLQIKNGDNWYIPNEFPLNDHLSVNKISNIFKEQQLFANNSRFYSIDLNSKQLSFISNRTNNHSRLIDARFDQNGHIWVCTMRGLWISENGNLIRPKQNHEFIHERVEAISFLSDGRFVLGTKGRGIVIWDGDESYRYITSKDGMSSNMIENIFIDSLDNIWVGTLNGLNKIELANNDQVNIKITNIKHGLPSNEITKVKREGDYIWVATTKGLCRFKESIVDTLSLPPVFTDLKVNGTSRVIENDYDLSYDQNTLQINYVTLDYKAKGDIEYRYRIQKEYEWIYTHATSLNFSNLSEGNYDLEIQSKNKDGYWSKSLKQSFKISPPFWRTNLFYIFLFLFLASSIFYYFKSRINLITKEKEMNEQLIDLERSALQAQMNPHFIFNILNSIQSAVTQNDKDQATLILAKFAKLIRATLNNARAKTITLDEEINYIRSYLALEKIRHKDHFDFDLKVHNSINPFDVLIPPMLIQPYVENALKHGLEQDKKGHIKVEYKMLDQNLTVIVTDNGSGFEHKSQGGNKSLGMGITKRRLELLNNRVSMEKSVFVNQLENENGEISGTEVKILIKFQLY